MLTQLRQDYAGWDSRSGLEDSLSSDEPETGNLKPPPETPDALAVALSQERETDHAPKIIAAGCGNVAEQILEIAFSQGIKVREDADLAQLLSMVDTDSEIPTDAFAAVAEILVYLYEVNGENPTETKSEGASPMGARTRELADALAEKWRQPADGAGAME